jgi:amino acid transporter
MGHRWRRDRLARARPRRARRDVPGRRRSARFPRYAFGSLVGFAAGWFAFLGAVTTAPIEVEAALQYSTNYVHGLTKLSGGTPVLTATGYIVAAALMLLFSVINVMGVKWLSETNKAAVWWKIATPV